LRAVGNIRAIVYQVIDFIAIIVTTAVWTGLYVGGVRAAIRKRMRRRGTCPLKMPRQIEQVLEVPNVTVIIDITC
jgi:hypothetical protein